MYSFIIYICTLINLPAFHVDASIYIRFICFPVFFPPKECSFIFKLVSLFHLLKGSFRNVYTQLLFIFLMFIYNYFFTKRKSFVMDRSLFGGSPNPC